MKNILKRIFAFFLCIIIILNICITTVYASELPDDEREELNEEFLDKVIDIGGKAGKTIWYLIPYVLTQVGFISNPEDLEQEYKNNEVFREKFVDVWTKDNIQIKTDSNGKKSLVFSKVVADTLIDAMKDATKDTDNGGYELVKTVPVSKISRLYFDTNEEYQTMFNLLKDNNGAIGIYRNRSTGVIHYFKVNTSDVWVKGSVKKWSSYNFQLYQSYKSVNASSYYQAYTLYDPAVSAKTWKNDDNLVLTDSTSQRAYNLLMYDEFLTAKEISDNPLYASWYVGSGLYPLLITNTGVSLPVFNTLDDAVEYSIAHNLYYTTSDFTGEGQEVTIDYAELDKILSGYYSGMYDMLQRLIEQNGGNALTPEQVQELADQVAESFDMLKAEINKGFEEQDALIQANSNILKAIKSVMEKGFENIEKLLEDILIVNSGDAVGDLIVGGIDILLDLAEFIKDFVNDTENGVASLAMGFTDVVDLVSQKFPFSIPWDIAFFVSSFADTPEAPVFELPIKLPRYGIDEKLVIDFSRFEVISKISRSMLTVIYAMGLLKLTDKIISNKKGGAV